MNYMKHSQVTQNSASPLAGQRTRRFWILGVALILGPLLAVSSTPVPTASADGPPTIFSITLNGGTAWLPPSPSASGGAASVGLGGSIDVLIVSSAGDDDLTSTSWRALTVPDGIPVTTGCDESPSVAPETVAFTITAPAIAGTYDLEFTIHSDLSCSSEAENVTILVLSLGIIVGGTPPLAATVLPQTSQDGASGISVDASTTDVSGDPLTYGVTGLPTGLSIDLNTGLITGTLDGGASQGGPASDGVYTVGVTANDGSGGVTTYQFSWTVTNSAPLAATVLPQTSQDGASGISVDASTTDVSGDPLTYGVTGLPTGLSIDLNTGLITGTLDGGASQGGPASDGVYTVGVTANDGSGGVTITPSMEPR